VIFPKTYDALKAMNQVIHDHRCIRKFYLTIVAGQLEEPLHLEGSMSRDELRNMTLVSDEGKYMETMVEPLQKARGFTLCRVEIRTGRTHQIRAQMADAGYPLAGDAKYGDPKVNKALSNRFGLTSQLLVARELIFSDMPQGYEYLNGKTVTARLPRKFTEMMGALGLQEG
jgi:23S rRNA pseudouridine955/2504/2580 synthase